MMKQLKCLCYGKLLKQFFIILLISCFTLLVDSFVNAGYTHSVGTMFSSDYDGVYKVGTSIKGQLRTVFGGVNKNVFMPDENHLLLFTSEKLPYIWVHKIGDNYSPTGQGYLHYLDDCPVINAGQVNYPNNCTQRVSYTSSYISDFMNSLVSSDILWYDISDGVAGNTPYGNLRVCISSQSYNKSLCFVGGTNNYCTTTRPYNCNNTGGSLFGNVIDFNSLVGYDVSVNPGDYGQVNIQGQSDFDGGKTNQSVYDSYLNYGFYKRLCYSDFYTGTLIYDDDSFNQFFNYDTDDNEPYSGATVFDYKAIVYPRWPNEQRGKNFYNMFKISYENQNLNNWVGRPTGLWQIMWKIYNGEFNSNFSFTDYFTFCDMAVNGFEPGSLFTGDTSENFNNYYDSNTEVIVNFGTGAYSGETDIFNAWKRITSLFHDNLQIDLGNRSPILPNYIVIGFIAMLLLYSFKR